MNLTSWVPYPTKQHLDDLKTWLHQVFDPDTNIVSSSYLPVPIPYGNLPFKMLNIQTTAVGNVGGGTDPLMTYQLAADAMSADGDMVLIIAAGGGNASDSGTLTFTFDGNALNNALVSSSVLATTFDWLSLIFIARTGAATQHVFATTFVGSLGLVRRAFLSGTVAHNQAIDLAFFGANATDLSNDAVTQRLMATLLIKAP